MLVVVVNDVAMMVMGFWLPEIGAFPVVEVVVVVVVVVEVVVVVDDVEMMVMGFWLPDVGPFVGTLDTLRLFLR